VDKSVPESQPTWLLEEVWGNGGKTVVEMLPGSESAQSRQGILFGLVDAKLDEHTDLDLGRSCTIL
jgi:hypothetical protein